MVVDTVIFIVATTNNDDNKFPHSDNFHGYICSIIECTVFPESYTISLRSKYHFYFSFQRLFLVIVDRSCIVAD